MVSSSLGILLFDRLGCVVINVVVVVVAVNQEFLLDLSLVHGHGACVSFFIKSGEQSEEHAGDGQSSEGQYLWVAAIGRQGGHCKVEAKNDKLKQLNGGDVLLPPQVGLERLVSAQGVVGVHDCVDGSIDYGEH